VTNEAERGQARAVRLGNQLLTVVEDVVYVAIAGILAAGAGVLLVSASAQLGDVTTDAGASKALLDVLDTLLLTFIFVELLFTVRATLAKRRIVAEPFLIVGIIAGIKEIVVLAIKAQEEYVSRGPEFARAMAEIGILGALVLALSLAALALRRSEREPEEPSGGPELPQDQPGGGEQAAAAGPAASAN
jgi:uncharacterized membrane protein (DUF373 family)